MLEPRRSQLARPTFQPVDQPASFVSLAGQRVNSTHLRRDLGQRRRAVRVQLRQSIFGGVELCFRGPQPAARFVVERPQFSLGRHLSGDNLTQAHDECEIELLGQTAHWAG